MAQSNSRKQGCGWQSACPSERCISKMQLLNLDLFIHPLKGTARTLCIFGCSSVDAEPRPKALGQFRIATVAFHGKFQGIGIEQFPPPLVPLWWQKTRVSCGSYFGSREYAKSQSMGRLKCSTQFTMDTTFSPASGPIVSYAPLPFDFWFWKGTPHKSHRTNICKDQSTDQFLLTESNHPNFILGCRPDHGVVV